MNERLHQAVSHVLDYLLALQEARTQPREARAQLQTLRALHPNLQIDLLAEEEAFDQSIHYDALIQSPGEGTVSLSYCPERVVPWPLRGVHSWREGDLVRVNANVLPVDAAMACLDFIWDEAPIIERLVNMCLIQEELDRQPIDLNDAELQQAMNQFRAAKKLFKTGDTLRWLERHGMTHEKLERYVADRAIVPKLRDRITADHVEEYFRQHTADFDTARIARVDLSDETQARELAAQIRSGAQDFFPISQRVFLEAADRGSSLKGNLFSTIERRQADPGFRDQLFAAAPGQLIGPVPVETRHVLFLVLEIVPADLDGRTRATIKDILFEKWLAERRHGARIEWCWGNAAKTS